MIVSRRQGRAGGKLVKTGSLLCLVLFIAATVLLPSGAAGMEDCESSESGQELLPVLFHAMRFTSCGGTETHNGLSTNTWMTDDNDRNLHVKPTHIHTTYSKNQSRMSEKADFG